MLRKSLYLFLCVTVFIKSAEAFILDFRLKNDSGITFHEIWLSPSSISKWNRKTDLLSREYNGKSYTLPSGFSTLISFSNVSEDRRDYRYWDLRVYDAEGKRHEWNKIDIGTAVEIIIDSEFTLHITEE